MSRIVVLTIGYEIDLEDEEGFERLFNAIVGEVTARFKESEEFSDRGFGLIYDFSILKLHYVAGQLCQMESRIGIGMLLDEFGVHWDSLSERLNL